MVITVLFAALTPRLDLLIALSGALTTSILGLVIPAICDMIVNKDAARWVTAKNLCLIILGMGGWLVGTVVSGEDLIQSIIK